MLNSKYEELLLSTINPKKLLNLSDWMDQKYVLLQGADNSSAMWKTRPFQIGIAGLMQNKDVIKLAVKKGTRVGYTKILTAFVVYKPSY